VDAREGKDGRRKKRGSLVCFSSLHFALGAVAGGYMYKGARVPVARSLAISSIVSRSQSCSTRSQCSFLDPTSQLQLIGRLGVFLSLAFRLDHVCLAQRPASDLSFLALSARYQVPSSFNSTPGYPNFLARRWR